MKRTRLKPRGRRWKRRHGKVVFGPLAEYARSRPCCICGAPPPSDPHHVRSRGAGFADYLEDGSGNVVPMCRGCHNGPKDHEMLGRVARVFAKQYRPGFTG